MCEFIKNLFGGGQSDELLGLMRAQQAETQRANALAEEAARSAKQRAEAALASPADTEAGRLASERRIRRLLQTRGPEPVQALGAAPISYRVLMGT